MPDSTVTLMQAIGQVEVITDYMSPRQQQELETQPSQQWHSWNAGADARGLIADYNTGMTVLRRPHCQ